MTLRYVSIFTLFLLVLSAAPAQGQDGDTRFGIGVGLDPIQSAFTTGDFAPPVTLYFPIQADGFRIEPQFGLSRRSEEQEREGQTREETRTAFQIGTGVFATPEIGENTIAHFGGRIGIVRFSRSLSGPGGSDSVSLTDFFLGPAAGGEHFLSESFSLGGEVQLLYVNEGEGDTGSTDVSITRFQTGATFFARVYF